MMEEVSLRYLDFMANTTQCPMKGLVKEIRSIKGFTYLTYECYSQKISKTARAICNFKFEENYIDIFCRENAKKTKNLSDWQKECESHMGRYYTCRGNFLDIILLPDLTRPGEILWNGLLNLGIIKKWCGISNNKLGLIIPNYDIIDHFNFYGVSNSVLQKRLGVKCDHKNGRRLLVFNTSHNLFLIIRVASDASLKDEISLCVDDVKLLILMLKDELEGSGVVVTGLIVYFGDNPHLINENLDCHCVIVSTEVFETVENIEHFCKSFRDKNRFEDLDTELAEDKKHKLYMAVASKLLGYITQYQYKVCEEPVLPTSKADAAKNIAQTHLLLDRCQMEIVYSRENRIILKGDYGTGKTIICLKKIEVLSKTKKEKEVIYYIIFHRKSELDFTVREKFKGLDQNVKILKCDSTLSNTIENEILPKEESKNAEKIHLFVDEYNIESLTQNETSTLVRLFTEKDQLKNSTILIALQPLETERADFHFVNGKENEYVEKGNMLGDLENIMTVKHLRYVMRTTVEVNDLIEITQEYLNEKSNIYTRQRENKDWSEKIIRNEAVKESSQKLASKGRLAVESENIQIDIVDGKLKSVKCMSAKTIDVDELHKLTSTANMEKDEDYQKRVTTFRYYSQSAIGHNIQGPVPELINIPPSASKSEMTGLFATFYKIMGSKAKRTVFIHFEANTPLWLETLFSCPTIFPKVRIADNVGNFLSNSGEQLVLIKNYNEVRGMEFSNVILLLDANEYHLKQFIPEAMARCQNKLSIIIQPSDNLNKMSDTVNDLLKYWEKVNADVEKEKPIIKFVELKFCTCLFSLKCRLKADSDTGCQKSTKSKIEYYEVHKNSVAYKRLSKEIQQNVVTGIHSADLLKLEGAMKVMDEIYHQSKSKMLASMDAENVQSKPMKNQSETYTQKPKEATHFRRSLEINYSQVDNDTYDDNFNSILQKYNSQYPLHEAASENDVAAIRILLDSPSFLVDAKDEGYETPLHHATQNNSIEAMKLLLQHGALAAEKNEYGETPLHHAASTNSLKAVELLLKHGVSIGDKNNDGETPIHHAASTNSLEAMILLLQAGASVGEKDDNGETPLHHSAKNNSINTTEMLLEKGASVDDGDDNGDTALHCSAYNNSIEAMKMLLQHKASHDIKNEYGKSPLHYATSSNSIEAMEVLLDCRAFLDARDDLGSTPLHCAASNGNIEAIILLYDNGANMNLRDIYGRSPFDVAHDEEKYAVVQFLENTFPSPS